MDEPEPDQTNTSETIASTDAARMRPRRLAWGCLLLALLLIVSGVGLVYGTLYVAERYLPEQSAPIRALKGVEAYRELGAAGSSCLNEEISSYDPVRQSADRVMVDEPPEDIVAGRFAGQPIVIERVVIYHRLPHAQVWVRQRDDAGHVRLRVLTLTARTGQTVTLELPHRSIFLCYAHVGGWMIVEDEPLPVV